MSVFEIQSLLGSILDSSTRYPNGANSLILLSFVAKGECWDITLKQTTVGSFLTFPYSTVHDHSPNIFQASCVYPLQLEESY